jgi:hypothetical protein
LRCQFYLVLKHWVGWVTILKVWDPSVHDNHQARKGRSSKELGEVWSVPTSLLSPPHPLPSFPSLPTSVQVCPMDSDRRRSWKTSYQ